MRVHHIAMTVRDLEASASFYKENFGFTEVNRFTKPGWKGSAVVLQLEGFQLEIFQFQNAVGRKDDLSNLSVLGLKHISIEVADVRKKQRELAAKGLDIDAPSKGTSCAWFCFLRDPDGLPIELYEPS
ncbi:MAG: VOC family protein [Candidatus Micrarchaeia archaeon]